MAQRGRNRGGHGGGGGGGGRDFFKQTTDDHTQKKQVAAAMADMTGVKFMSAYYKIYDFDRSTLIEFYRPGRSTVCFNGEDVPTNKMKLLFNSIPRSQHRVKSCNVQPILVSKNLDYPSVLITVNGTVCYLGMKPVPFTQTVVLQATKGANASQDNPDVTYYVASDMYRTYEDIIPNE